MKNSTAHNHLLLIFACIALILAAFGPQAEAAQDNNPILLIHGMSSTAEDWNTLPTYLERRGWDVYTMDFDRWDKLSYSDLNLIDLRHIAAVIGREIAWIKGQTGAKKVNVIAHSIAGIAVRAYVADWGREIDPRGRYKNDINKILYLNTPQYGFPNFNARLRKMLRETDWGKFYPKPGEAEQRFFNDLKYGSQAMGNLMLATRDLHPQYGIKDVTIASRGDEFIKDPYLNSLGGLYNKPMTIPRPDVATKNYLEDHLVLPGWKHASSKYNGNPNLTLINVGGKNHPTYKIARMFFSNIDGYRSITGGKSSNRNLTFITLGKDSPVAFKNFDTTRLAMYRVKPNRLIGVKLNYHEDMDMYSFRNERSDLYQLTIVGDDGLPLRFDLNLAGGTVQVLKFSDDAFEPDPGYQKQAMDNNVGLGDVPATMKSYNDLRQFTLALFPFESRVYKTGKEMKALANDLKDMLHEFYPNLIRRNDIDVFGTGEFTNVDYLVDADGPGILANKLNWQEIDNTPVDPEPQPGDPKDGGDYPDSPPANVNNLSSLKEFSLWYLRGDAHTVYHEKKIPAALVRDKLAAMYSNIVRLNDGEAHKGYTAPEHKHRDAIFLLDKGVIIDFVFASSAPGALYPSLSWIVQTITPW